MVLIMPTVVTVTLAAGWQLGHLLGTVDSSYVNHDWIVASYIVVGIMAVIALGLLEPANVAVLLRVPGFARERFFGVAKWALVAYVITAGMIEYTFLRNGLSGGPLVVLTLSLVVYAVHVPMLIGFTVARYDV